MRQVGKVFSLYNNSDEICNLDTKILEFKKDLLIKELQKERYVVDEVKGITARGESYISRYIINSQTKEGLEEVGNIVADEVITRDCKSLDEFLESYIVK